jgi:hypothetical protein
MPPLMSNPAALSNLTTSPDHNSCPYTLSGTGVIGMENISMCNIKFTPRDVMPVTLDIPVLASRTETAAAYS